MQPSSKRKVKIVCTLGPSSSNPEMIGGLIDDGLDIARLNFSHGTHAVHQSNIEIIRKLSQEKRKAIAIMQDLQGPKIRAGVLPKGGIELKAGDIVLLHPEGATPRMSTVGRIAIPISAEIAEPVSKDTQKGARILFDDGKIWTRAIDVRPPEILIEVEVGGLLTSNKGMNFPGTPLSIPCVTDKDFEDLKFGLSQGVDAVALSFVRSASDIETIKEKIKRVSNDPPIIIAKMERDEAVDHMDSIIEVTDGIMVARGDLAVEVGAERVPTIQKRMIQACNELGVPVITATQMLESMIQTPTPTRAEANDVANAVFDGTDCVMLSGETASGKYPRETVRTMARIIIEAERAPELFVSSHEILPMPGSIVESIEFSASRVAQHTGAVAIACLTHSGMAARVLAKYRPSTPIVAILDNEAMLRRLQFVWGINGVVISKIVGTDDLFAMVESVLIAEGYAQTDDLVVVTAGVPTLRRGTTNMIKVHRVGAVSERSSRK